MRILFFSLFCLLILSSCQTMGNGFQFGGNFRIDDVGTFIRCGGLNEADCKVQENAQTAFVQDAPTIENCRKYAGMTYQQASSVSAQWIDYCLQYSEHQGLRPAYSQYAAYSSYQQIMTGSNDNEAKCTQLARERQRSGNSAAYINWANSNQAFVNQCNSVIAAKEQREQLERQQRQARLEQQRQERKAQEAAELQRCLATKARAECPGTDEYRAANRVSGPDGCSHCELGTLENAYFRGNYTIHRGTKYKSNCLRQCLAWQ